MANLQSQIDILSCALISEVNKQKNVDFTPERMIFVQTNDSDFKLSLCYKHTYYKNNQLTDTW